MRPKLPLYCIAAVVALIAGWGIWEAFLAQDPQGPESISQRDGVSNEKADERSQESPPTVQKGSAGKVVSGSERDGTTTIKIKLIPIKDAAFVAREVSPTVDYKYWNKTHDLYLVESTVWYELYDRDDRKLFRFPNYINVDAGGSPGALDRARGDIRWQWADDSSVIGVQQIIQRAESAPPPGLEGEFSEFPPDSVRIYLYDVKKLHSVYELVPPEFPRGLVVRLEGVSNDGRVSLAALSPEAYDRGGDIKSDPKHYKYLGVYGIDLRKK